MAKDSKSESKSSKGSSGSRGGSMGVGSGKGASTGGMGSGSFGGASLGGNKNAGSGASTGGMGSGSFGGASLGGSSGRSSKGSGNSSYGLSSPSKPSYKDNPNYQAHMAKVNAERKAESLAPTRGSTADLASRAARQSAYEAGRATTPGKPRSAWDSISSAFTGAFRGTEDTEGFGPVGGPKSYGMSNKAFDATVGSRRHAARSLDQRLMRQVDYFKEAPMDYISDLLNNPLISGAAMLTGAGPLAFGIQALDAAMDYAQNEATAGQALGQLASAGISFTPAGAALGEAKGVVKGAIASGVKGAVTSGSALAGAKVGGVVGAAVASGFMDNPYAYAATVAGVSALGAYGAKKAAKSVISQAPSGTPTKAVTGMSQETSSDSRESPLVASGKAAVKTSERLMEQTGSTNLYAKTVEQLPYYGVDINQNNMPYYGV
ncbi:hypothetical protein CHOED_012 [Vibrio phage CHOED]|uniref:hypothetical protein n=1 Tax=Vibrio phage CHOED TaxID=1458716 RepID=UPI00042E72F4|nr:hypothetical protein CHOED_012 [Vibrio phage CHOED]AHK11872.1 hypothetical protein CHOED_012 [Vibrio phage CHOED]